MPYALLPTTPRQQALQHHYDVAKLSVLTIDILLSKSPVLGDLTAFAQLYLNSVLHLTGDHA